MLFPEDQLKRRAYIARLWAGFYPTDEEANLGEPVPRSVLLSIMKAAVDPIDKAEIEARYYGGVVGGEEQKVVIAIEQRQPKRASWNTAAKLVERQTGKSRAFLYRARSRYLPVIHLWAAYILRGQQVRGDDALGYTALDDVQVFVTEAMALLQWAIAFKLDRKAAQPTLDRNKVDFWITPRDWLSPTPKAQWPRDGRIRVPMLPEEWLRRVRTKPVKHSPKKPVHAALDN